MAQHNKEIGLEKSASADRTGAFRMGETKHPSVERSPDIRSESVRKSTRIVAHDVRGILSSLLIHLTNLQQQPHDMLDRLPLAISTLHGLIQRVDFLVRQCLDAGGTMFPRRRWIQLRELVDTAVIAFQAKAERAQITLINDVSPDATIISDPQMLAMVITNMVDNSLKYCPPGSTVRAGSGPAGQLWIEDDGPGLVRGPQGARNYSRGPGPHDQSYGIGLQTMIEICQLQGDHLELFDRHHTGTRHVIHFNRQFMDAMVFQQAAAINRLSLTISDLWGTSLQTRNLMEAVTLEAGASTADVIVVDATAMPARDFADLCALVTRIPSLKETPMVFLNASPTLGDVDGLFSRGAVFVHHDGQSLAEFHNELAEACVCPPGDYMRPESMRAFA